MTVLPVAVHDGAMTSEMIERFDRLPFGSPDKSRRYETGRYQGAVGLNWYDCDPTLKALMRRHLPGEALEWATPHLRRIGALMGGPIAERAELTDRNPPRLEKYDRWGHDISRVVFPDSFEQSRRDLLADNLDSAEFRAAARDAGVPIRPLSTAWSYMLNQAEIAMACALGTGTDMVERLVEQFAPPDVRERVRALSATGELAGQTAQMLTERTGGSDLAMLETTATPDGDAWRLNGFKWFASNANGAAFVVLAKPVGADDGIRGIAPFLVLWDQRDGSRNGVRIRRLKDKLGTKGVASCEVELDDAEAFMLAPPGPGPGTAEGGAAGDGRGVARMMEMTNGARLGIAMMGLGCARRSLVESLCYARTREAFGHNLIEQPLMQRKLAELIVEVEAAQQLVFDGYLEPMRISAPLIKLRAARLGITASADALEIFGGNGYVEQWPIARIVRDSLVNPVWEGPDNILCLDVRRAIEREDAHKALIERMRVALERAPSGDDHTLGLVEQAIEKVDSAIDRWGRLDRATAEYRLFQLSQMLIDAYAAALLLEHAGWEASSSGGDRGSLVARLYVRDHLGSRDPLERIDEVAEERDRFAELVAGALVDDRVPGAAGRAWRSRETET